MRPRDFIIGLALLSLFIGSFANLISSTNDFYNVTTDPKDEQLLKLFNQSFGPQLRSDVATKGQQLIEESEQGETATEDIVTFKGITSLLKLPFQTLEIMSTLLSATAVRFGLEGWQIILIFTMMTVGVVFTIASAFMRREI